MINSKILGIYILYIILCVVSVSGLIWLTQFSFKAKVSSVNITELGVPKFTTVKDVDITDSNLTTSKIAIVSIWIQILLSFAFVLYKLIGHAQ
jgi:hypothetical protein